MLRVASALPLMTMPSLLLPVLLVVTECWVLRFLVALRLIRRPFGDALLFLQVYM
jgi:hypothetical protein